MILRYLPVALLLFAAPAFAQTTVPDPARAALEWTQAGARGTAFDRFEVSIVTTGQPANYVSIGLPTPQASGAYRHPLPATLANGAYTAAIRACLSTVVAPASPCSAGSGGPFTVARTQTPPAPTNFQIVVTVADGQVSNIRVVPQP